MCYINNSEKVCNEEEEEEDVGSLVPSLMCDVFFFPNSFGKTKKSH